MKVFKILVMVALLAVCATQAAQAAGVGFEYTVEDGIYSYTVTNGLSEGIGDFLIFFDRASYDVDTFEWVSAPSDLNWDIYFDPMNWAPGITEDPYLSFLGIDGYLLGSGETLEFSFSLVKFAGAAGGQTFEVWDGATLLQDGPVEFGGGPSDIPEPGTLALFGTGIAGLVAYYRMRKNGKANNKLT